jgi:PAS domain S-box-containing protein
MLILQDERVVLVNRAVSAVSGYTQQELLSLSLNDLMAIVHPADQERIFNGIGNILSGNSSPVRHEFRIVRKDGSIRWVDTLASSINYRDRPALQLAYLDITERKQAEEELRVSRDRFKTIFARAGMGIVVANIMGCIEDCNVAFSEMLGYDKEELLKKHFKDITFSEDVDKNLDLFRQMIAGKTDRYEMEKRYRSKDGRQIWCNLTASAIRGDNGELLQILALVDDISERKEAEEAIATSNRKVAEILESIQDGFFTMDRNWCFTYANTRAAANLGLKPEELLGQNLWEKFPVIKGTAHEIAYRKSMEDRVVQRFETKGALTDKWYDISVYPSGEGISVYWQDITEHKQSEEELQKSEHRYRTLFESIQEGFYLSEIIVDDDGRLNDYIYLDANKAFERIMGLTRDQIIGKRAKELVPDLKSDWLEVFNKVALTGEPARYNSYSEVFHRYFEIFILQARRRAVRRAGHRYHRAQTG